MMLHNKNAGSYSPDYFSETIKTRGVGFFHITKIVITLSILLSLIMLVVK